jgi:hypothetical protein
LFPFKSILRGPDTTSGPRDQFTTVRTVASGLGIRLIRLASADDAKLIRLLSAAECYIDHPRYINDVRRVAAINVCGAKFAQRARVRDLLRTTERHVDDENHIDDIDHTIATGWVRMAIAQTIACIAHSVAIPILLLRVPHRRTVIAYIPDAIRVIVRLVKLRDIRTIVARVTPGV